MRPKWAQSGGGPPFKISHFNQQPHFVCTRLVDSRARAKRSIWCRAPLSWSPNSTVLHLDIYLLSWWCACGVFFQWNPGTKPPFRDVRSIWSGLAHSSVKELSAPGRKAAGARSNPAQVKNSSSESLPKNGGIGGSVTFWRGKWGGPDDDQPKLWAISSLKLPPEWAGPEVVSLRGGN